MIQLQAGRYGMRLTWTGNGLTDLVAVMNEHATAVRMSKHLWGSLGELMQLPEMRTLPESIQAQIASIILKSRTLLELETDEHARRLAKVVAEGAPRGAA